MRTQVFRLSLLLLFGPSPAAAALRTFRSAEFHPYAAQPAVTLTALVKCMRSGVPLEFSGKTRTGGLEFRSAAARPRRRRRTELRVAQDAASRADRHARQPSQALREPFPVRS